MDNGNIMGTGEIMLSKEKYHTIPAFKPVFPIILAFEIQP